MVMFHLELSINDLLVYRSSSLKVEVSRTEIVPNNFKYSTTSSITWILKCGERIVTSSIEFFNLRLILTYDLCLDNRSIF